LTTSAATGGTIVPKSDWYNSGASVAIGASANSGYLFSGFTGTLSGAANPQTLTILGPSNVTANFLPDFNLSTATGAATVMAGSSTTLTVTGSAPAGSNAVVTFDAPGLPAGITATFNPPTVTGSGQTTMTISAQAGTGGYYVVYARGTSNLGTPSHTTGINLAVQDFTVTPIASTATAVPGSTSTMFQWAITPLGGYTGGAGVSSVISTYCGLSNWVPGSGPDNVTLYVLPLLNCQAGDKSLTVTIIGNGVATKTVNATLTITSTSSASITLSPITQTVAPGAAATWQISVNGINSPTTVGFNTTSFPSCTTLLSAPMPVTGAGTASFQLGTAACAAGTYQFPVVSSGISPSVTAWATLIVSNAPAPSTLTSPGPGTTLSGDTVTFTWTAGSQVTQNQLTASTVDESNNTVICPRPFAGVAQAASVDLGVCCPKRRTLTATLSSTFALGGSQSQSYTYTCGPPTLSPSGVSVTPSVGTGSAQSFTAVFYDVNGGSDITQARLLIQPTSASGPANACIIRFLDRRS
jgi:hypothetical protein